MAPCQRSNSTIGTAPFGCEEAEHDDSECFETLECEFHTCYRDQYQCWHLRGADGCVLCGFNDSFETWFQCYEECLGVVVCAQCGTARVAFEYFLKSVLGLPEPAVLFISRAFSDVDLISLRLKTDLNEVPFL